MSVLNMKNVIVRFACLAIAGVALTSGFPTLALAQFDGFLQPYRQVDLASDETGIIQEILVMQGQHVETGEPIAKLTSDLEQVQYELATHLAQSRGNYMGAEKSFQKRQTVFDQVKQMRDTNHANETELMRAELELELSAARLVAARDELIAQDFDMRRAKLQLDRRTITAPISGFVSLIHCREGEYVSPVRSDIVTIVNVDRLYGVFNIPSNQAEQFEVGKTFHVRCSNGSTVDAIVEYVGVAIDAESGTVEIRLVIENEGYRMKAGDSCVLTS